MKKYLLYGFIIVATAFAGVMARLLWKTWANESVLGTASSDAVNAAISPVVRSRGKTASGAGGNAILIYTGDIVGSLEPCG